MKKETKKELTEQQLAILNQGFPVSDEETRQSLKRFGMLSKDIVSESGTGRNKKIVVEQPGGTFYIESDKGEVDEETGKKKWSREFLEGEEVDVIITYHRKQLRKFDSSLNKFISSPVFDTAEQVIPLYLDKQIIKRGTPAELQSMYPALTQKGKPTSDLKEETILYVLYEGELHQFNLSQSSKWAFKDYKKSVNPSTVVTTLGSSEETFGTNTYRKVTFKTKSKISADDFDTVVESQTLLKDQVESDGKLFLASGEQSEELKKF